MNSWGSKYRHLGSRMAKKMETRHRVSKMMERIEKIKTDFFYDYVLSSGIMQECDDITVTSGTMPIKYKVIVRDFYGSTIL